MLAIFDFGGQDVFNVIHHLFLTRYGIYFVVFRMIDLVSTAPLEVQEMCLEKLSFWLNSIVVHTLDGSTGTTAPVCLVGTRKDNVKDPAEHRSVSELLERRFGGTSVWSNVQKNSKDKLSYFPVDNSLGRQDPTVAHLMCVVEEVLTDADYVKAMVPLSWLKVWDGIAAKAK